MRTVTLYYAFDNTSFETPDECRAYEATNIANQLVGLTQKQVARAISREDTELADAIEEVGKRIANARRESGDLRRRRAVAADQLTPVFGVLADSPGGTPPTAIEQPVVQKPVSDLMYPGIAATPEPDAAIPTERSPEPGVEPEDNGEASIPVGEPEEAGEDRTEPPFAQSPIDSPTGPWRHPMTPRNDEERGRAARRAGRAKPDMTDPDYSLNLAIGWTYEDGVMKKEGPRAA